LKLLALGIPLLVFVLIGWLPLLSLIALAIAAWRTRGCAGGGAGGDS
jgi:hypothetical protein